MGRLDELDLSLKLAKSDYAERLEAAQTRLTAPRANLSAVSRVWAASSRSAYSLFESVRDRSSSSSRPTRP